MNIEILNKVNNQIYTCYKLYGAYASSHEAMGVLFEEIDELFDEVKQKELNLQRVEEEIIDCITVLVKMHQDVVEGKCDSFRRKCNK